MSSLSVAGVTESLPVRAWLSLGSNIQPRQHIRQAMRDLHQEFGDLQISPVYESEAVGCAGDNFYNLVVGIYTRLSVLDLSKRLREIEEGSGRRRDADKFAPRTLDIDLLTYGSRAEPAGDIELPRDEIRRYAFVLLPLSEVAGDELHPLTGKTYRELWQEFNDPSQVLWRVELDLETKSREK